MTPSRHPHPQRCIHSRVCRFRFVSDADCDGLISGDASKESRCTSFSAPHTSAPAPALPEESEQWREAYQNGFTDGQAKAAIENERINAQVAKAAREQVLKEIPDVLFCQSLPNEHGFCGSNDCFCKELHRVESGDICKWMQSIRSQQEAEQQ